MVQIVKSERKDVVCTEGDDTVERERETVLVTKSMLLVVN